MQTLSIIIPAYNEEKRIGKTLESYCSFLNVLVKKKLLRFEIVVVINNTKDDTEKIVKKYMKKYPQIRYLNFIEGGKGYAVSEGFKDALKRKDNQFIGFVDADMATTPEEFYKLFKNWGRYSGVIGDRYMKGSKIIPPPTIRRLLAKRLFNFVVRSLLVLPYRDTQCGAKIFTRRAIEVTLPYLSMSQWAFDVELLYLMKKKGFRIVSKPTNWVSQDFSTINFWKAGPMMTLGIVRLRLIHSPVRRFINIYDKFVRIIPK